MGIVHIYIVELHTAQTLVEAGHEALARAPVAIGTGPHEMSGLGGYEEFVAMGVERLLHVSAETLLGRTIGRTIVVGQIEVANAVVERVVHDIKPDRLVVIVAKIVPKA